MSQEKDLPLLWGPGKNVRWRTPLPGTANSSPIVSGGRVFLTVAQDQGKKRTLLCLDRQTGKILWSQMVSYPKIEPTQNDNPYCGSTPASDGERVVVWHSSAGLYCYDFEGKILWSRDLGAFDHMWGYGSSPIFYQDRVILNCGPGDRTFLVALDKTSGKTLWQQNEPGGQSKEWVGSWSTPRVAPVEGNPLVLLGYPGHVNGYDPASGKVVWTCEGFGKLAYADVTLGDGIGVATGEDEGGDSLGFSLGGSGNVTSSRRLWAQKRSLEVGTGLIVDGHLWTVDNSGILRCTEAKTGKEVLKERSPKGAAWSSMVSGAGRIYYTTRSGDTVVLRPDPRALSILGVNPIGEPTNATPALSGGEIFLRTSQAAYCISEKR
jgi:outer membrane protein assembly factor BamB